TCTAYPKAGEACGALDECDRGLYCNTSNANHVCQPDAKPGDPCQSQSDCGPGDWCVASPTCTNQNVFCDATTNQCKAGVAEGEACGAPAGGPVADQIHCSAALWCDAVFLDKGGVCRKPGGAGSPCNNAVDCTGGLRCIGYVPLGDQAQLGKCAEPSTSG